MSEFKYFKIKGTVQPDKIGLRMIPLQSWLVIHRRLQKFDILILNCYKEFAFIATFALFWKSLLPGYDIFKDILDRGVKKLAIFLRANFHEKLYISLNYLISWLFLVAPKVELR